jgi:hypothetical protein
LVFVDLQIDQKTFQIFLCLFAIRKDGKQKILSDQQKILSSQRKIFSGQRKTFSSQRKILLGFQESIFSFGCVCFPESGFRETTFQTFMCLFAIKKVGQRKTLSSQRKIWLGFSGKCFPGKFGRKTLSGSCEKFRNVIIC